VATVALIVVKKRSNKTTTKEEIGANIIELKGELPLQKVTIHERIGGGQFGNVFRGTWQRTEVALKKLSGADQSTEFAREVSMLK
jgi:predicted Ser/Thr protein kinase